MRSGEGKNEHNTKPDAEEQSVYGSSQKSDLSN